MSARSRMDSPQVYADRSNVHRMFTNPRSQHRQHIRRRSWPTNGFRYCSSIQSMWGPMIVKYLIPCGGDAYGMSMVTLIQYRMVHGLDSKLHGREDSGIGNLNGNRCGPRGRIGTLSTFSVECQNKCSVSYQSNMFCCSLSVQVRNRGKECVFYSCSNPIFLSNELRSRVRTVLELVKLPSYWFH